MPELVLYTTDTRGIATLTLNRPEKHNAFDAETLKALSVTLTKAANDSAIRAIVLTGAGQSFCSGADLSAMRALINASEAENLQDALQLSDVLAQLNSFPKPTLARINGNAFGGAVGLIACCDIAVAAQDVRMGLTEVRLGLLPAVISPYVVAAIGARQARRYFQTGELFGADEARRLGLVHETCVKDALDGTVSALLEAVLKGSPQAQREAKELITEVSGSDGQPGVEARRATAKRLARLRISAEGQEGMGAFLEKRPANWIR